MFPLLLTLLILISLWIVGGLFAQPISLLLQHYWPTFAYEGEQLLLWGGVLLSAFAIGLLVMYLVLRA